MRPFTRTRRKRSPPPCDTSRVERMLSPIAAPGRWHARKALRGNKQLDARTKCTWRLGGALPGDALVLAPEAPYPLAGGGALRTASLLHYLAGTRAVDLIVFREPAAAD